MTEVIYPPGLHVKVSLARNGFIYRGPILRSTHDYLVLRDEKDGRERLFNLNHLELVEVLP